jgi:NitT/TauT family transport system ATP-binding protein
MLRVEIQEKTFFSRHQAVVALADVRFEVAAGEFACLVGPSGCGKSTMLNLIGGLDRDVKGEIRFDGGASAADVGHVFQTPRLMPWLNVLDNVRLVLPRSLEATAKAEALLSAMGLGNVLDAWPNRLSGGMQRRVSLARAFAIEPRLMLLDEPFVSLDAPTAEQLRAMLIDLWQSRGTTVLFVTHDLREALALGDKVFFMSTAPGRIVLEVPVNLPRPRRLDDSAIDALRSRLLDEQPDLLTGMAA